MKSNDNSDNTADSVNFPLCVHNNKRPGETSVNGGSWASAKNAVTPNKNHLNQQGSRSQQLIR